ncbi:hypothetical protein AAKU58_003953 [Oxalobacteraceae bacterium GrIS 1.18]
MDIMNSTASRQMTVKNEGYSLDEGMRQKILAEARAECPVSIEIERQRQAFISAFGSEFGDEIL